MGAGSGQEPIEYPDSAGYPDGAGVLDEGTGGTLDEATASSVRAVDRPSADAGSEIRVQHDSDHHVYAAVIAGRRIASLHYDVVGGRVVVLTTTVAPEFRGRGIAPDLIADALDGLRELGLPVTVRCPVVAAFIAQHPQYADLAAPEGEIA
ncbi:GNAT family N-acetyltransferase [Agromyces sp. CFH 90414]|uniref:GNAT family N-acetyltransferase n=1 Tax=Agromyces agglutinans TaxID=2662258 RepID=A0A6I2F6M8_9MICO|nr:GNAT family N-acetyltransferase [Agromyces agglutinans]MRG60392.1 GNAT family N-acetyltransferase [Agromyces agglutinans]